MKFFLSIPKKVLQRVQDTIYYYFISKGRPYSLILYLLYLKAEIEHLIKHDLLSN